MNRIEIEIRLNRDRAWLLETLAAMSDADLAAPRTPSEHDPAKTWSFADHFIHTTLIEQNWNAMFRRHIAGEAGMQRPVIEDGEARPTDDVMAVIHRWTERWADSHRGKPLAELARVGLAVRADTLALLAELTDEQLASVIPGAPWADGTVGGIMAANADHGRRHYTWAKEGTLTPGPD
ncbi:MAG: DinB family protein [Dehalococcoidia bacterium]